MYSSPSISPLATCEALTGVSSTCDHDAELRLKVVPYSRPPLRETMTHGQSFPIGVSPRHRDWGVLSLPSPPSVIPPEHSLRRKTPNGTVDEGYDGTPTHTSHAFPPLKHKFLPSRGRPMSVTRTTTSFDPRIHGWSIPQQPARRTTNVQEHDAPSWPSFIASLPSQPRQVPSSYDDRASVTASLDSQEQRIGTGVHKFAFLAEENDLRSAYPFQSASTELATPDSHRRPAQLSSRRCMTTVQHFQGRLSKEDQSSAPVLERPGFRNLSKNHGFPCSRSSTHVQHVNTRETDSSRNFIITATAFASFPYASDRIDYSEIREMTLASARECYVRLLSYLQESGRSDVLKMTAGFSVIYDEPSQEAVANSGTGQSRFSRESVTSCDNGPAILPGEWKCLHLQVTPAEEKTNHQSSYGQPSEFTAMSSPDVEQYRHASIFNPIASESVPHPARLSPLSAARSSLQMLQLLCEQSDWRWIDGMLLGGCLQYGLECYEGALRWFSRIVELDASHVEAITNTAASLFCLNRQNEAEQLWLQAVKLRPSYLEASEHLVGLLYKRRSEEAIDVISFVQRSLRNSCQPSDRPEPVCGSNNYSSGYRLPASENGRLLALLHAKGTMLYSLGKIDKASEAFEEVVLISTGRLFHGIYELTRHIQLMLSLRGFDVSPGIHQNQQTLPSMLPPEMARCTAQLVFTGDGDLPGLLPVRDAIAKKAAVQTTSNSLLSLAKILQDAISSGGADPHFPRGASSVGDILALYYLSLSLQESPSTANNVGILLAGIQQTTSIPSQTVPRDSRQSTLPNVTAGSGIALAMAYYNYGLRLDPNHVHLHTNLGSLLKDMGHLDLAIQMYERAVSCDGTFDIALTNLANAVKDKGRIIDAIAYYRRAVTTNPGFDEAVCGLFTALNSVCNWRGRGGVLLSAGDYDRWHVDNEGKLLDARVCGGGRGLAKRVVDIVAHQLRVASQWGQHILQESVIHTLDRQLQHLCEDSSFQLGAAIRQWAGKPWEGSRLTRLLERATRVALRRWYLDARVRARGQTVLPCVRARLPPGLSVPTAPTVLPFHTFTCPLQAGEVRAIARCNALRISCSTLRSPWLPSTLMPPPSPPSPQLNVGYLSSDFNNHPLAHLMQSVFGFHNPNRVRVFCYATTTSDASIHRRQIEAEAPVFRDFSGWSPERVVGQIGRDHIHILVNLNGYTRGARNEIFAARPAPIQMSFMGFAGSLGAEWCDYILADKTVVPPPTLRPWRRNVSIEDVFHDNTECSEGEWVYSENVIFCRNTFFCCDHAQSNGRDEKGMSWEEETRRRWEMRRKLFPNMPDDTIILGNFNQLYKIEPTIFRSWLRILSRIPNAILWLLRFPEPGERNLRAMAEAWAGPEVAKRLMFTDVAPKNQHIARARVCDLFLDTPECNAHTTAADVLWSSTPLLTLPRYPYKMCSRIAASILRGALPQSAEGREVAAELIVDDETEYEQRAVDLAGKLVYMNTGEAGYKEGRGKLADIRRLLWENRWQCGLFDTRRWVEEVECAYEEAWRRWVDGVGGDIYL
ncbi:hypothetical protein CP533_5558 [Ophiocordyceps camponoti-saundersi (nom. inval.)]|nr:hypothetical protein CP533_5558 [Ophiocordyceps camponoti-saundersi (nom. inval.)]